MTDRPGGRPWFQALLRNNGIARRLLVALILFSSAITAVITAIELYLDYRIDVSAIDERIESIRKVYLSTLTESVWVAERSQIQNQLDGLLNLSDIEHVAIVADGKVQWAAGDRRSARRIERVIPLIRPHRGQIINIGDLHVVGSIDNVLGRIGSKLVVMLVSNGVKTLLVTGFLLVVFQTTIGRHLEQIAAYLRGVGMDLASQAPLRLARAASGRWRPDALDQVTDSLNAMRERLASSVTRLVETHQALETIVASSPLAIVTTDRDGRVLQWSPAAERLLGWRAAEAAGRPMLGVPDGRSAEAAARLRRVLAGDSVIALEETLERRDGATIEVSLTLAPLRGSTGAATGCLVIAADITEQKLTRTRLLQAQKMEAIGQLAGGVAHDFNNIIGTIQGFAEFLVEDLPAGGQPRRFAQRIGTACERARELVQQILGFARREPVARAPADLRTVIADARDLLEGSLPAGVTLAIETGPSPVMAEVNAAQMTQILLNLGRNALDAMGDAGCLTLAVGTLEPGAPDLRALERGSPIGDPVAGDGSIMAGAVKPHRAYAAIAVRDTGSGITPEVMARIFEPFFTTKPAGRGTGLGLAVVHGAVLASDGVCRVDSRPGAGTTVTIYLPLGAVEPAAPSRPDAPTGAAVAGAERVLLVDDSVEMTEMVATGLRRLGYAVTAFNDPEQALAHFLRDPGAWDAVVSDQVMPGLTGTALCARIKALRPALPFVLCSGFQERDTPTAARAAGVDAFFQKPVSPTRIAARLRELVGGPAAATRSAE